MIFVSSQIDISPMTNLCNVRNTILTTANAELYLTVIGFGHMWSYTVHTRRIIIGEIRYLGGTRFSVESLVSLFVQPTPSLLHSLSCSCFLYLAPVSALWVGT